MNCCWSVRVLLNLVWNPSISKKLKEARQRTWQQFEPSIDTLALLDSVCLGWMDLESELGWNVSSADGKDTSSCMQSLTAEYEWKSLNISCLDLKLCYMRYSDWYRSHVHVTDSMGWLEASGLLIAINFSSSVSPQSINLHRNVIGVDWYSRLVRSKLIGEVRRKSSDDWVASKSTILVH